MRFLPQEYPHAVVATRDSEAWEAATRILRREGVRVLAVNRRRMSVLVGPRPLGTDGELVASGATIRPWWPPRPCGLARRLLRKAASRLSGWKVAPAKPVDVK